MGSSCLPLAAPASSLRGPQPRCRMDAAGDSLPVGAIVFLHGLQKRPELDYHLGRICRAPDAETGRYGVQLHRTGLFPGSASPPMISPFGTRGDDVTKPLALKPQNLAAARAANALVAAERLLAAAPCSADAGEVDESGSRGAGRSSSPGSEASSSSRGAGGAAAQSCEVEESFERQVEDLKRGQLAALEAGDELRAVRGAAECELQTREHRLLRRCCAATAGRGIADAAEGPGAAAPLPASFAEIVQLLGCTSLPRNAVLSVGSFVLVPRARIDRAPFTRPGTTSVKVSSDSDRGDFPLTQVLSPDTKTWYMSAQPRFTRRGEPRLTFGFPAVRRIAFVGVRIPPMPMGPLSVRTFFLEVQKCAEGVPEGARAPQEAPSGEASGPGAGQVGGSGEASTWERVALGGCATKQYQTLDVSCTQEFAIWPPVEAEAVRMVLTSSAENSPGHPVGMYYVGFA